MKASDTAERMVGKPYKFRGQTPEGFDCSGLVRYSYRAAGVDLPHGTAALRKVSHPIAPGDLRRGDLLFFNERGARYSHVALSLGNSRFVHAPSSGKSVRIDSMQDPYWKDHFGEARRLELRD